MTTARKSCDRRRLAAVSAAAVLLASLPASGPARAQQDAADIEDGARAFRLACASCHGEDGRGEGPVADYLTTPPADLTQLSNRFGGAFPELLIRQLVDGRATDRVHGDPDMPVWGDQFMFEEDREVLPDRAEAAIRRRIASVVEYLRQIQEP